MTAVPAPPRVEPPAARGERLPTMYASRLFAVMTAGVILVTLNLAAFTYGGTPLCAAVAGASIVAFAGWLATTFRRPETGPAAFRLSIATVVALLVLYAEQWHGGFAPRLMHLYPAAYPPGVGLTDHAFVAVFPLAGSALLLAGALAYYHGSAFGRFAAWFTFAWGAVDALAVYAYPLIAQGRPGPLPGMLTAPLPLVCAILGIRALVRHEGLRSPAAHPADPAVRGGAPHARRSAMP